MPPPGWGRLLYREELGIERVRSLASVGAFAFLSLFLGATLSSVHWAFAALFGLGVSVVAAAILWLPRRSAVYEGGVILGDSLWKRLRSGRPAEFGKDSITAVCPFVRVRPMDGRRVLVGYRVSTSSGEGRVYADRDPMSDGSAGVELERALRTMLGPRWEALFRAVPTIDAAVLARLRTSLSQSPKEAWSRATRPIWALMVGFFLVLALTGLARAFRWTSLGWVHPLVAMAFAGAGLSPVVFWRRTGALRERLEAFSLYAQVRDHERRTGANLLPPIAVHPDYGEIDPVVAGVRVNPESLQRDLSAWVRPAIAIGAGGAPPIVLLLVGMWIRVPYAVLFPLVLASMLACLAVLAASMERLRTSVRAGAQLKALVREEWRTGRPVLPPGFRVPRSSPVFRVPPRLTSRDVRRLRRARRLKSPWYTACLALGLVGGIIGVTLLARALGLPVVAGITALLLMLLSVLPFLWRTGSDLGLLRELQEYEEVTGRSVLPPDLSHTGDRTRASPADPGRA